MPMYISRDFFGHYSVQFYTTAIYITTRYYNPELTSNIPVMAQVTCNYCAIVHEGLEHLQVLISAEEPIPHAEG